MSDTKKSPQEWKAMAHTKVISKACEPRKAPSVPKAPKASKPVKKGK